MQQNIFSEHLPIRNLRITEINEAMNQKQQIQGQSFVPTNYYQIPSQGIYSTPAVPFNHDLQHRPIKLQKATASFHHSHAEGLNSCSWTPPLAVYGQVGGRSVESSQPPWNGSFPKINIDRGKQKKSEKDRKLTDLKALKMHQRQAPQKPLVSLTCFFYFSCFLLVKV